MLLKDCWVKEGVFMALDFDGNGFVHCSFRSFGLAFMVEPVVRGFENPMSVLRISIGSFILRGTLSNLSW